MLCIIIAQTYYEQNPIVSCLVLVQQAMVYNGSYLNSNALLSTKHSHSRCIRLYLSSTHSLVVDTIATSVKHLHSIVLQSLGIFCSRHQSTRHHQRQLDISWFSTNRIFLFKEQLLQVLPCLGSIRPPTNIDAPLISAA